MGRAGEGDAVWLNLSWTAPPSPALPIFLLNLLKVQRTYRVRSRFT